MTRFDEHTAVTRAAPDRFEGRIDESWTVVRGPNGGYVAAIVLAALTARVDDPRRSARSLTVQFMSPPQPGPVVVTTAVERQGRSVAFLSARLFQDDEVRAAALAVFAPPRPGIEYDDARRPDVQLPEDLPPLARGETMPPFFDHWDHRPAVGAPPFSGADEALSGGWMRLTEPRIADALLLTALSDAWAPAPFARVREPMTAPTLDLTVHFRRALPAPGARDTDHVLGVFRSRLAHEGFFEEDGELWSRDGVLLAQSRQLAMATLLDGRRLWPADDTGVS